MEEWTLSDTEYGADQGIQHKHACHKPRASTIQTQHSLRPGSHPVVRTSPPQTLDPRESPIISQDMKLETLQGQQCSEKHCLMMHFFENTKWIQFSTPLSRASICLLQCSKPSPPSYFMDANFFCGEPTPDCTDVSEDKHHRCPESKMNWNYTSNNTSQLSVLIFKCTQTKSSVPLKSKENAYRDYIFSLRLGRHQESTIHSLFKLARVVIIIIISPWWH